MTETHGPIHLLVNNAAVCFGRNFMEQPSHLFRLTMDINFMAYVHLTRLFLAQKECSHLVNVISIAGHMACGQNSDYCASKFALTGFVKALRFEIEASKKPVKMTNFYPYYIDTGLFEGFKPKMRYILPTLNATYVA